MGAKAQASGREDSSFLKKRTKKLMRVWAEPIPKGRIRNKKPLLSQGTFVNPSCSLWLRGLNSWFAIPRAETSVAEWLQQHVGRVFRVFFAKESSFLPGFPA
jgi:hypothetical protein